MKLGLRQANQQFSKAIKAVRAGKEVILTDRGQPIAVIKPITNEGGTEAVLRQMAAEGLITLPVRKGRLPVIRPITVDGTPISRTIIDDRDDRV